MNPQKLSLAGLVLLLILGIGFAPTRSKQGPTQGTTKAEAKSHQTGDAAPPVWKTLCQLNPTYGEDPAVDEKLQTIPHGADDPKCLTQFHPTEAWMTSVIATVADPVRTNLGLWTDRTLETIQAASAEAGYVPYLQGLQWRLSPNAANNNGTTSDPSTETSAAQDGAGKRTDNHYPGVLIFRDSENGQERARPKYLAVFLVSETPTSGLDKEQFLAALRIIGNIPRANHKERNPKEEPRTILVAGPNFSGSVPSLREIADVLSQTAHQGAHTFAETSDPVRCLQPFSGTITNANLLSLGNPACETTLEKIQTDDQTALHAFRNWVVGEGIPDNEVAVLSEEGTRYGRLHPQDGSFQDTHPDHFLYLHFPRGIAALRNATDPGQSSPSALPTGYGPQRLPLRWQDSESQLDEVPLYGAYQTSLSEETVLVSLANTLRTENIQALGIMASDPWDVNFLIHWFTEASPNVRLFVRDVDLLYLRTPDIGSVTGILALSDYPLIAEDQFWSDDRPIVDQRSTLTLPSATQEAQYNAFTELLERLPPFVDHQLIHLEDKGPSKVPPGVPNQHLWLAATGTAGYLPIKPLWEEKSGADDSKKNPHFLHVGNPPYAAVILWGLIALVGVAHAIGVLVGAWQGRKACDATEKANKTETINELTKRKIVLPCLLTFDLGDPNDRTGASKFVCHAIALSTAALGAIVAGTSFIFFSPFPWAGSNFVDHRGAIFEYSILAFLVVLVTAFVVAVAIFSFWAGITACRKASATQAGTRNENGEHGTLRALGCYGAICVLIPLLALGLWLYLGLAGTSDNAFMHLRDMRLGSGIAPVLPIVFLIAIFYLGIWIYLRRVARWEYGSTEMPTGLDDVFPSNCNQYVRRISRALLGFPETPWGWILLGCFIGGIVLFRPVTTMEMLEPKWVQWFTLFWFCLALLLLWSQWLRFLYVWEQMQSFLRVLEKLPMRTAFSRISAQSSLSIWGWNVAAGKLLPVREAVEALRGLHVLTSDTFVTADTREDFLSSTRAFLVATSGSPSDSMEVDSAARNRAVPPVGEAGSLSVAELKHLYHESREAMINVIRQLIPHLQTYWHRGEVLPGDTPIPVDGNRRKTDSPDQRYELAEEFVALRFYSYIRYVGTELRHLLMFVVFAFFGLFVALHSYAFRASRAIDIAFVVLFVILALGIILALGQQERDALLSRLQGSNAGELGTNFYLDVLKYAALPALALIASQVPSISNFFLRWIQPGLDAFH